MRFLHTSYWLFFVGVQAFGWGELGHHIVGRTAAKLVRSHPLLEQRRGDLKEKISRGSDSARDELKAINDFVSAFSHRWIQEGHVSNIPDIHWRNLGGEFEEDAQLLGDTTHFLDSEHLIGRVSPAEFFKVKIPLNYQKAKATFKIPHFFQAVGTLPWRAQQFVSLLEFKFKSYPKSCGQIPRDEIAHPTTAAMAYAGLLSHKIGDASQPYHTSVDYDGAAIGQKGIHSFFETTLVDAVEWGLDGDVFRLAEGLLKTDGADSVAQIRAKAREVYGEVGAGEHATAVTLALIANSFSYIKTVADLDLKYSVAPLGEALNISFCSNLTGFRDLKKKYDLEKEPAKKEALLKEKVLSRKEGDEEAKPPTDNPTDEDLINKACRRSPFTKLKAEGEPDPRGKSVADWHRELIQRRIAVGAAVLADLWVRAWLENGQPSLCSTYRYATRPNFISPTDENCFGYALDEDPNASDFKKTDWVQYEKDKKTGNVKPMEYYKTIKVLPWKKSAPSIGACFEG